MKSNLLGIVVLCLGTILAGCSVGIRGSGNVTSQSRNVSGFTGVELTTVGSLSIEQTGSESLTIEAEDNILPLLTSDVSGGTLVLGTKPNSSFTNTKPVLFKLTVKDLNTLKLSGSGEITVSPLKADSFTASVSGSGNVNLSSADVANRLSLNISGSGSIKADSATSKDAQIAVSGSGPISVSSLTTGAVTTEISGNGNITLAGSADGQTVNISSSGNYNADSLDSKQVTLGMSSSGSAALKVSDKLDVTISGSGTVTYTGDPTVTQKITGSGRVTRR